MRDTQSFLGLLQLRYFLAVAEDVRNLAGVVEDRAKRAYVSELESNRHLIAELEQYRRLLDNLPAELGVFDTAGRFLFNTPSGIRDPATREWVLGKTHHD